MNKIEYYSYKLWVLFVLIMCVFLCGFVIIPSFTVGEIISIFAYLITGRIFKTKFIDILKDGVKIAEEIMRWDWINNYGGFIMEYGDEVMNKWAERHKYSNKHITDNVGTDDKDEAVAFYRSKYCSEENKVYLRIKWGDQFD